MENTDRDLVRVVSNVCLIVLWIVPVTFNYYVRTVCLKGALQSSLQLRKYQIISLKYPTLLGGGATSNSFLNFSVL